MQDAGQEDSEGTSVARAREDDDDSAAAAGPAQDWGATEHMLLMALESAVQGRQPSRMSALGLLRTMPPDPAAPRCSLTLP